jgi:16S rRNA (guanine527-N7)-methyltransferase
VKVLGQLLRDHEGEFGVQLTDQEIQELNDYYDLILKWNPRLHLIAPCGPEEFAVRHLLESLLLLPHLPIAASVVDVGSGAGLPIIPCVILRPDLRITLIESSTRKSVFLREALRQLPNPKLTQVLVGRFENLPKVPAQFVTCRAIDRFEQLLPKLIDWAPTPCTLLFFGGPALREALTTLLPSVESEVIPGSHQRLLIRAGLK